MKTINTYEQLMAARQAGLPDVAVATRHWQGTREWYRNGWKIYSPGKSVEGAPRPRYADPDNGCRIFEEDRSKNWRQARKEALEAAMAWAGPRYSIEKWARNRMGDYVDARVNKQFPLERR